jgi:spore maturation protein CgeB
LLRSIWWHLGGHRPLRLKPFSAEVIRRCDQDKPSMVLTTGLAPLSTTALIQLRQRRITTACYLTDDPWNPQHRAPWFMSALRQYDHVFTPRRANFSELQALGHPRIYYLPFAYAPDIHHPPEPLSDSEAAPWKSDVLFIGGADQERASLMRDLDSAGLNLSLWGGYWNQMAGLQSRAKGHAGPSEFRKLVAHAGVNVCLVRRANRDGHSMRSFEIPAVGGCMVVEDTPEHREIFGPEDRTVRYFTTTKELVDKCRALIRSEEQQRRLAEAVGQHIRTGKNTYGDRLASLLISTGN